MRKTNRKIVSVALSLIVVVSMVGFYVASAKNEGGGSPWESILDVFVTGGSVNISSPVVLEAGTHVDVSGSTVDVSGSSVDVSGFVSLEGKFFVRKFCAELLLAVIGIIPRHGVQPNQKIRHIPPFLSLKFKTNVLKTRIYLKFNTFIHYLPV